MDDRIICAQAYGGLVIVDFQRDAVRIDAAIEVGISLVSNCVI